MKFRIFAATATVAFLGTSALMVPTATAATVDVQGSYCTITFSAQDLTDIQNLVANADNESLRLLKAEFPAIGDRFDILYTELADQMEKYGDVYFSSLSDEARQTYFSYIWQGTTVGYTENDLTAMLIAPLLPALLAGAVGQELGGFTDPIVLNKAEAQLRATALSEEVLVSAGFDVANRTYGNLALSPKAFEIVSPSINAFQILVDEIAEPFEDCAAGRGTKTGGNGGGSSFGSS